MQVRGTMESDEISPDLWEDHKIPAHWARRMWCFEWLVLGGRFRCSHPDPRRCACALPPPPPPPPPAPRVTQSVEGKGRPEAVSGVHCKA